MSRIGNAPVAIPSGVTVAVEGKLDVLPIGVVLLSTTGNVVAANQLAKKIIETDDVFSNGTGGLGIDWGWRRLRLKDLI